MLFNYGNLLRLLAVKKLLADHWSVVKIREFMSALDTTALEQLVTAALVSQPNQVTQGAETGKAGRGDQKYGVTQRLVPPTAGEESPAHSMSLAAAPPLASLAVESARRAERASAEWI